MSTNPDHPAAPTPFLVLPRSDGLPFSREDVEMIGEGTRRNTGLTKREELAKAAMQGLLASGIAERVVAAATCADPKAAIARASLGYADALIDALNDSVSP